jgi:hypothetical protein
MCRRLEVEALCRESDAGLFLTSILVSAYVKLG